MAVLFLAMLLVLSSQTFAASNGAVKTITVTITQTTEDDFTCDAGLFQITEQTKVFNKKGEETSLGHVAFPCQATVTYEISMTEKKNAIRVNVLESLRSLTPPVAE